MSNFLQDQGNQGIARPVYRREQANPQIDAEIAASGTRPRRGGLEPLTWGEIKGPFLDGN